MGLDFDDENLTQDPLVIKEVTRMDNEPQETLYLYEIPDPLGATVRFLKNPVGTVKRKIDDSVLDALWHGIEPPQKATLYDQEECPEGREVEIEFVYYMDGVDPSCGIADENLMTDSCAHKVVFHDPDFQAKFM